MELLIPALDIVLVHRVGREFVVRAIARNRPPVIQNPNE
jgi:hypothetical protein